MILYFLAILEIGHIADDQVYFMSSIPKIYEIRSALWQSFHFQKITGTLKINIFFFLICRNLNYNRTSRNRRQKEN